MIRAFSVEDIGRVVDLWNQALCADKITEARLRSHLLQDENFDQELFLLDEELGVLRGFAIGLVRKKPYYDRGLEPGMGWVFAFGVLPQHRQCGIATALLDKLELQLRERGAKTIVLGMYSPGYLIPGLDVQQYPEAAALLQKRGYATGKVHTAMYRTLFCYEVPKEISEKRMLAEQKGYRFVRYTNDQASQLVEFIKCWFSAGWLHNTKKMLREADPSEKIWLCIDPNGGIAGFVERGMGGITSRFGPFGIRPDCRNLSLGSILLSCMLYDMSCKGIYMTYFMTTDESGARMYTRNGFSPYRQFYDSSLSLEP